MGKRERRLGIPNRKQTDLLFRKKRKQLDKQVVECVDYSTGFCNLVKEFFHTT